MIKSIEITNYKRIKHLEVGNFNNVNVIVGKSGVVKLLCLKQFILLNMISLYILKRQRI